MAFPSQIFNDEGISSFGSINFDAAGRQRNSLITTLFDGKTLTADDTNIWETVGTGTSGLVNNKFGMSVTSGQFVIRRSKSYISYFSGKSLIVELTMDGFQSEVNTIKRAGYFSSNTTTPWDTTKDGFWLENDGITISLQIQNSGVSILSLPLYKWDNYDKIKNYDWSKFTVLHFDFLWLGGTALRLFIVQDGQFILAHTFKHAGKNVGTFIKSPSQNVRYELRSSTGTGSMNAICSQVATEGSLDESGKPLAIFNSALVSCNVVGTVYAVKGIKKNPTYRDTPVQITGFSVSSTQTNTSGVLLLIKNPTLSVGLTYANNSRISDGSPTTPSTPPTITLGTGQVISAVAVGQNGSGTELSKSYLNFLAITISDVSDEYIIAFEPSVATQSINAVIVVKEY